MDFEFDDKRPIYIQLVDQIKLGIISGVYSTGEKLPSVRDYAVKLRVNPNTINRALLELEEEGLIITKRTSGKFVTEDLKVIENIRHSLANTTILKFIKDMKNLNILDDEIIKLVKGELKWI